MDGTILDAMGAWFTVSRRMLEELGRTPRPNFDHEMKAHEGKDVTNYLIESYNLDCTPEFVSRYTIDNVLEEYRHHAPAKAFAHEHILELHELGIPMCVCTGSFHELCDPAFERLGFDKYFRFTLTPEDVGGRRKEFPDIYLTAAERLGISPANCLVYEDTFRCLQTAHGAGFRTVGVYDDASKTYRDDIRALADLYIHSFEELV